MTVADYALLLVAGLAGGVINSVASGGSFFTYPAMLATGMAPIEAAASTLAALTPGNLAAVPEYWPEVRAQRERYPELLAVVSVGGSLGIALLFTLGADGFSSVVPWLVLAATGLFAASPVLRTWAEANARTITDGGFGLALVFVFSIYLTFFGSGVGNVMLAMLVIRGFGDFFAANAAKNIVMTLGTTMATIAYTISGWVQWQQVLPVLVGSAVGAAIAARHARSIPQRALRWLVIAFGLFVALWLLARG